MATGILDIIDTAVKIGLGASISGVTAYLLSSKEFTKEIKKKAYDNKIDLIKGVSINFESARKNINSFAVELHHFTESGESTDKMDLKKLSKLLSDAEICIQDARAKANLLGLNELCELLGGLSTTFSSIVKLLYIHKDDTGGIKKNYQQLLAYFPDDIEKLIYLQIYRAYEIANKQT